MSPTTSPPAMLNLPIPSSDGGDKKHSSLLIIIGICAGVVIIAFIIVLIICSCSSGKGRKKIPVNETRMHLSSSFVV